MFVFFFEKLLLKTAIKAKIRVYKGYFRGAVGATKIFDPLSTRYFGIL